MLPLNHTHAVHWSSCLGTRNLDFNRRPENINFQSHNGCIRPNAWNPNHVFPFCIFRFCISVFLFSSEVECPVNGLLMFSSPITAGKELHQIPSEIHNSHIMLFLNLFATHTVSQMCFLLSSIDLLQLQQNQHPFYSQLSGNDCMWAWLQAGNFPTHGSSKWFEALCKNVVNIVIVSSVLWNLTREQ